MYIIQLNSSLYAGQQGSSFTVKLDGLILNIDSSALDRKENSPTTDCKNKAHRYIFP